MRKYSILGFAGILAWMAFAIPLAAANDAGQTAKTPTVKDQQLPQLKVTGPWVTAADGDVVILRGVNLVSKTSQTPEELGFDERNAALLARRGFNVVRLGVVWANVEPYLKPDGKNREYNTKYLDSLNRTISLLAEHGIYTLVDFHQDAYAAPWGYGAPAWAVVVGGENTPSVGFPKNVFGLQPNVQTDVTTALDAFWQNKEISGTPLQEHYADMVEFVARYFRAQGGNIMGYDPLNEPTPGSLWVEARNPKIPLDFKKGTPTFDKILGAFYNALIPRLRSGHPDATVWFEANILHGLGAKTYLPKLSADNVGFNFHNYTPVLHDTPVTNALDYQKRTGAPILCSEFGATTNTALIEKVGAINDRHMVSAIYWAYFNNPRYNFTPHKDGQLPSDPRKQAVVLDMTGRLAPDNDNNVNIGMLNALTRVYPRRISGTPQSFAYEPNTKRFDLTYTTRKPNGTKSGGVTEIIVPVDLFPTGYVAKVENGKVTSADNAPLLLVTGGPPEEKTISVHVTPRR
jgi:endoglycosylceramidase